MQPIAAWLVARPHSAVLGLAASFLLPMAPVISGSVMVLLALQFGVARSGTYAAFAAAVLAGIALATGSPVSTLLANVLSIWAPAILLAAMLRQWRSVTLTLQVTVIIAIAAILSLYVVIGDTNAFGAKLIADLAAVMSQAGLQEQADILDGAKYDLAPQMLLLVVFLGWQVNVLTLLLGYAIAQTLQQEKGRLGRFRDLNMGRVLAALLAVSSVAAWFSEFQWLQNAALLLFLTFWMQGLAVVHWLRAEKRLPAAVLIVVYVSLPFLHVLPLAALAAAGYADAWVGFRRGAGGKGITAD